MVNITTFVVSLSQDIFRGTGDFPVTLGTFLESAFVRNPAQWPSGPQAIILATKNTMDVKENKWWSSARNIYPLQTD